ncbi:MAG: hypothetical protein O9345_05540 [Burkholderiaceae bacterium]|nr:hypothetical protein [Burkholderiaceae bacterium]
MDRTRHAPPPDRPHGRRGAPALAAAATVAIALAGCASVAPRGGADPRGAGPDRCAALVHAVDRAVDAAGVRDAQHAAHPASRWLRVDRFAASFAAPSLEGDALRAWLDRMREADARSRDIELDNLPDAVLPGLAGLAIAAMAAPAAPPAPATGAPPVAPRDTISGALAACGASAVAALRADPDAIAGARAGARVPDDYSDVLRAFGLYPLAALPFAAGVEREEAVMREAFARHAGRLADGTMQYLPARRGQAAPALPLPLPDALGVPRLDASTREALLAAHAPVWAVAGDGPDDRIGRVVLAADDTPRTEPALPTVYGRVAFTRWEGGVRVQLVYTAWFPRRAPASPLDPLAGHLDAVVLRATLDGDGRVAMVDSIHACGCWHLFVPVGPWRTRPAPREREEWAFVPARLDAVPEGTRLRVRLAARTHAVEGIDVVPDPGDDHGAVRYALVDDDTLRRLPRVHGGTRSLYDARGRVPGSERAERWLFWPMGIPDAGTMRQWGRQPTAFVGRRHFDDADLLERRFERAPGERVEASPVRP